MYVSMLRKGATKKANKCDEQSAVEAEREGRPGSACAGQINIFDNIFHCFSFQSRQHDGLQIL